MIKNNLPTRTWNPWKPVVIKKVDPKAESLMLKVAIIYSNPCNIKKYNPKIQVNINRFRANFQLFLKINWWAQVTLTPDANKITVFNKGTWKGLKGTTPHGGHNKPNSIVGLSLEWKYAQKKDKKKKISLTINKIIPNIKPLNTILEW